MDRLDYINTAYVHDDSTLCSSDTHDEEEIHADGKTDKTSVGAYIIPLSRDYWRTLFGFEYDNYSELLTSYTAIAAGNNASLHAYLKGYAPNNTSLGFSNSRGVVGLVDYDPANQLLKLDGTTLEAPYFNEEFIRGENAVNAALGEVYENVDFPFAYNEATGYYELDSTRAYYAVCLKQNTNTGKYYMDYYNYSDLVTENAAGNTEQALVADESLAHQGVKKADASYQDVNGSSQTIYQFYPFNSPETNDRFATENLMFGMKLDIPFNMPKDADRMEESMFEFSGEDDVDAYEFVNPKHDLDCDAFETFYSTNDSDIGTAFYNREAALQTGFVSAAAKRSAIVIPQTDSPTTITIEFKQSNATPGVNSHRLLVRGTRLPDEIVKEAGYEIKKRGSVCR